MYVALLFSKGVGLISVVTNSLFSFHTIFMSQMRGGLFFGQAYFQGRTSLLILELTQIGTS